MVEHQQLAKALLGFKTLTEPARRQWVAHLRQTRGAAIDAAQLMIGARQWLYEHGYLIPNERHVLDACRGVLTNQQSKLVAAIENSVPVAQRRRWAEELAKPRAPLEGQTCLDWLKQSPRSRRGLGLAGAFERIHFLNDLKVDRLSLPPMPLVLIKAYAARTARLKLTRFARLQPATQTIGLACFLKLALWRHTDEAIEAWLMRVSEVRRLALERAAQVSEHEWQQRHGALLSRIKAIAAADPADATLPALAAAIQEEEHIVSATRAERARAKLMEMSGQVRTLLRLIVRLPIQLCSPNAWLSQALPMLRGAYRQARPALAKDTDLLAMMGIADAPPILRDSSYCQ